MSANLSALIAATVVLLLIPGPNVAIIVATSLRDGLKYGLITTFGTTAGLALQLALVVIGMAALIEAAAATLSWIKWAGVVYLVWLGVRTRNEPAADLADAKIVSRTVTFWRGFGLAIVNPKTLLFNAAFLPQFVPAGDNAAGQLVLVASVFLGVVVVGDSLWAVFAAAARKYLINIRNIQNKVTGALLACAGLGLALSRRTL